MNSKTSQQLFTFKRFTYILPSRSNQRQENWGSRSFRRRPPTRHWIVKGWGGDTRRWWEPLDSQGEGWRNTWLRRHSPPARRHLPPPASGPLSPGHTLQPAFGSPDKPQVCFKKPAEPPRGRERWLPQHPPQLGLPASAPAWGHTGLASVCQDWPAGSPSISSGFLPVVVLSDLAHASQWLVQVCELGF